MVFFPNCKINIGLDVLRRREDGYHDIETVMFPVHGLCDILEVVPSDRDGVELSSGGLAVDCRTTDNLCYRAYQAVAARYDVGGVKLHLHKIIPFGAGLGGGSADATFTVKALSSVFSLGLRDDQIEDIAAELGSDTVFFVRNRPAVSSGRGELLRPVVIPELDGKVLLIVKPDFGVSTATAYAGVKPHIPPVSLSERVGLPLEAWKEAIGNAFEESVFARHPTLAGIKHEIYGAGAVYASMSGSGSAMYGIFEPERFEPQIKELFADCFVYHQIIRNAC
ncbi:MAG: 4-(cytidine 5'-diphospho)-2-C-methyl-D-erythritol kinase [Alistipes sp.]|nr:4-(cytidine 5'-diphospho)-2-C-methyl-D-erythritol kinase [Alistipes sp.]